MLGSIGCKVYLVLDLFVLGIWILRGFQASCFGLSLFEIIFIVRCEGNCCSFNWLVAFAPQVINKSNKIVWQFADFVPSFCSVVWFYIP